MPPSTSRPARAPQVLPYLYYPDAAAALTFLVEAFGFTEIEAVRDEPGQVWHAQLSTGDGLVMMRPGMTAFGTRPVADPAWAVAHLRLRRRRGPPPRPGPRRRRDDHHRPDRPGAQPDLRGGRPGGQQWIFATPVP